MKNDADDSTLTTARVVLRDMEPSMLQEILGIFIDGKEHSVEEIWLYVDGRKDRNYTYSEKLRRVTVYFYRVNKILMKRTGRFIGRSRRGYYKLLHRKL